MSVLSGTIDFRVYENGTAYLGLARITIPTMSSKQLTVNGAGIPGDVIFPVPGHRDSMKTTIVFLDNPSSAYTLAEMRTHNLDLRIAKENFDNTSSQIDVEAYKAVMQVLPLSVTPGDVAPASQQGKSNEYSCISFKEFINERLVTDYEPLNYRDVDSSGRDNLADVRSALGM